MNFLRRHWFVVALIAIAGVARFTILFASQTHVHSDEAIIGLMAKHISEGRYFPFYMYGQPYNASAAGEAYLAAVAFNLFGVSVVALKSVIVLLSLVCLFLFYIMAETLFDRRTANFSVLIFAIVPSLLKWHFQVRGYAFYFLAIPMLVILFWRVATAPRARSIFWFGFASGLSLWVLELSLTLNLALWFLLLLWRKMSIKQFALALGAFVVGYAPAIIYNFAYDFANWRTVFLGKTGGSLGLAVSTLTRPANLRHIFITEMPKFFGPDTVLWYYPERPWTGLIFYAITAIAIVAVFVPLSHLPARFRGLISGEATTPDTTRDLVLLFLVAACFVPYLLAPVPTASYFFGGLFFLSVLIGRLLGRCFASRILVFRVSGIALLAAMLIAGVGAMIEVAMRNEIETLSLCDEGKTYCMTRIPGSDIAAVEQYLHDHQIASAWTTVSLTYPLIFETRESVAISDAIFGRERNLYPKSVPLAEPQTDRPAVVIIETKSPLRADAERRLTQPTGNPPLVTQYGALAVLEQR